MKSEAALGSGFASIRNAGLSTYSHFRGIPKRLRNEDANGATPRDQRLPALPLTVVGSKVSEPGSPIVQWRVEGGAGRFRTPD